MNEFMTCIKKYATFDGRASRREYWMFTLFYWIIGFVLGLIFGTLGKVMGSDKLPIILSAIFTLAMLLPTIAVGARRLHDVNKSGWYLLIVLIPLGIFYILWLACIAGDDGENMYGPAPVVNTTPVTDISPVDNTVPMATITSNNANTEVNNTNFTEAPKIIDIPNVINTPNIIDTNTSNQ